MKWKNDIVVTGDFNIDLSKPITSLSKHLTTVMRNCNSKDLVEGNTKVTVESKTIIDHVLGFPGKKFQPAAASNVHILDHRIVYCAYRKKYAHYSHPTYLYNVSQIHSCSVGEVCVNVESDELGVHCREGFAQHR